MSPTAFMRKLLSAKVAAWLLSALLFIVPVTTLAFETYFLGSRFIAPLIREGYDNCFDTMLQAQRHGMELDQVISGYRACIDEVGRHHAILMGVFVGMSMSAIFVAFMVIDRHIAITIGKSDQSPIRTMEFIRGHIIHVLAITVTQIITAIVVYQIVN